MSQYPRDKDGNLIATYVSPAAGECIARAIEEGRKNRPSQSEPATTPSGEAGAEGGALTAERVDELLSLLDHTGLPFAAPPTIRDHTFIDALSLPVTRGELRAALLAVRALRAAEQRADTAERERDEARGDLDELAGRHRALMDQSSREREAYGVEIARLLDPVVIAKMKEPGPPIFISDPSGVVAAAYAERDRMKKAAERLADELARRGAGNSHCATTDDWVKWAITGKPADAPTGDPAGLAGGGEGGDVD